MIIFCLTLRGWSVIHPSVCRQTWKTGWTALWAASILLRPERTERKSMNLKLLLKTSQCQNSRSSSRFGPFCRSLSLVPWSSVWSARQAIVILFMWRWNVINNHELSSPRFSESPSRIFPIGLWRHYWYLIKAFNFFL